MAETAIFKIKNPHGLHARPGALLVAEVKKFSSTVTVKNLDGNDNVVSAKSLMKIMTIGVKTGHHLEFTADGDDETEALNAIGAVIDKGLGE